MSNKIIPFFVLASIFSLAALILFSGYNSQTPLPVAKSGAKSLATNSVKVAKIDIEKNYKKYAAAIFSSFNQELAEGKGSDLAKRVKVKQEELLALRVPAEYKDLHLDFVIGLGLIEKGLQGNNSKLILGKEKLQKISGQYPWLSQEEINQ